MDNLWLTIAAFSTSLLTALVGLGGGVVLILLMPGLMPLQAIIPVHALVQFVSNLSRVVFAVREVDWHFIPPVLLGSFVGALVGSQTVGLVSLPWLPAVAGVLILFVTWIPLDRLVPTGRWALVALGFYQTGLGMLAGATGPLGAAVLARIRSQRDWLVVNTGVYMMVNHGVRAVAFGLLGFSFAPWINTIIWMSFGMVTGALVGTRLRQSLPQQNFETIFRWVVTVLALRMVGLTVMDQLG